MRRVLFGLSVCVATACVDRPLNEVVPVPDAVEQKLLPVSLNRELDLLFVIDDSGSMAQEHASLESRFPELIARLDALGDRRPDLHVGVVSSNMGTGKVDTGDAHCRDGGDHGKLQGATCPALGGASFLSDVVGPDGARLRNYDGTLDDAFACMADLGTDGCGFEQHLASMRAALTDGVNPGFLRRSAALAVIIVADEDDCSADDDQLFTRSEAEPLGPFSDFRCFAHGVVCDPVADPRSPGPRTGCVPAPASPYLVEIEAYAAFLRGLKDDPDQVFVGAIIGDAAPVEVIVDASGRAGLGASCTGGLGAAAPGIRLGALVDAFGARGHRETICTGDLGAALGTIATALGEALPGACFIDEPADRNPGTPGVQPECAVIQVLADGAGRITLPACRVGGARPCWQVIVDDECTQTPSQLRLDVDRAGELAPAGAYLDVQCVVDGSPPPPR